nr:hypothetical protein [Verrucomicrobium sp. 3C]
MGHPFRKDHLGEEVALGILLPVKEMGLGVNQEGAGENRGAAARGGAEPDDLRA